MAGLAWRGGSGGGSSAGSHSSSPWPSRLPIIRIGFWGILYYNVIRNPKSDIASPFFMHSPDL